MVLNRPNANMKSPGRREDKAIYSMGVMFTGFYWRVMIYIMLKNKRYMHILLFLQLQDVEVLAVIG